MTGDLVKDRRCAAPHQFDTSHKLHPRLHREKSESLSVRIRDTPIESPECSDSKRVTRGSSQPQRCSFRRKQMRAAQHPESSEVYQGSRIASGDKDLASCCNPVKDAASMALITHVQQ